MKSGVDYFKGFALILITIITYFAYRNQEFDWNALTTHYGKFKIILALAYLLFGHIYGLIGGVVLGFYFIFRK
jgi:uncharacterized membrane protein YagU involved in acid resistance